MPRGNPRHYVVVRKRAFWRPSKSLRALGFKNIILGDDGPDAFQLAEQWNRKADAVRLGLDKNPVLIPNNMSADNPESATVYPPGTIGAAFREYRELDAWKADKSPRTREEWFRAWRHIKPIFGDVDPRMVKTAEIETLRNHIRDTISPREAHRVIKIWRALWNVMASLGYCERSKDPSKVFRNKSAKGRSETWSEGEVARLAKRAWRMGYRGLAVIIGVAWDTQLNPGDVRALTASQMAKATTGELFFTARGKTGVPVGGTLSRRTVALLAAYLEGLGAELHGDAPIFRNRSRAPYSKDTLGDDFRDVRAAEFGDTERRSLGYDFRRSGAQEAIVGGANAENLSLAMGNSLSSSNFLFATYVPVNAAAIRNVQQARRLGRERLR